MEGTFVLNEPIQIQLKFPVTSKKKAFSGWRKWAMDGYCGRMRMGKN